MNGQFSDVVSTSTATFVDTSVVELLGKIEYNTALSNNLIYWFIISTGTILMLCLLYKVIKIFII